MLTPGTNNGNTVEKQVNTDVSKQAINGPLIESTPTGKKAQRFVDAVGNDIKRTITGNSSVSNNDQYWFWGIIIGILLIAGAAWYYVTYVKKGK